MFLYQREFALVLNLCEFIKTFVSIYMPTPINEDKYRIIFHIAVNAPVSLCYLLLISCALLTYCTNLINFTSAQ